jgi:hypothetical protein
MAEESNLPIVSLDLALSPGFPAAVTEQFFAACSTYLISRAFRLPDERVVIPGHLIRPVSFGFVSTGVIFESLLIVLDM